MDIFGRYFCIRIKKFADTKISGYVWTGPKFGLFMQHLLVVFSCFYLKQSYETVRILQATIPKSQDDLLVFQMFTHASHLWQLTVPLDLSSFLFQRAVLLRDVLNILTNIVFSVRTLVTDPPFFPLIKCGK